MGWIGMQDRLLYIDYNMFGKNDIIEAFSDLGYEVSVNNAPLLYGEESEKTQKMIEKDICKDTKLVFTSTYYPMVSNICRKYGVKYISWTYDSPRVSLYDVSVNNNCNFVFVFDSEECKVMRGRGIKRVYYMPLGVNIKRLDSIETTISDQQVFSSDVSIVASLYNEDHNLYDRLYARLDDYYKGYLDGVVCAQINVYGASLLEDSLSDYVLKKLYETMPYGKDRNNLSDDRYIYANYFLARKVATYQRKDFIKAISEKYQMKVYTQGDISDILTAIHMGSVDYNTDMNKVFRLSKINLNITLPSIKTGIPLRALDIMGAGGFLLTDYRADMEGIFEPGVDYEYYTSLDDALDKIRYYIEYEDERKKIAESGRKKIEAGFTYFERIRDMLDIVNNS